MYTIDNKFEIGEECYSVYRKPIHYKCPICDGNGKFLHNGYEVWCKNCRGSGQLHNPQQCVMDICKVRVRRIIASVFGGAITVKYKVEVVDESGATVRTRGETNLFKAVEEAEQYCMAVNTKQIVSEF